MQRGQKSPVAVGQPGPRCPAAGRSGPSGPTASLPNPGESRDGGGLLLRAPRLLHRRGPVWLHVWSCAGKTAGRPLQSKHEGLVVPALTSCPWVVPVSTGAEKLHLQPDEFHVSGISRATAVHVLLHIPFLHSRYSRFRVLGRPHGKQPTTTGPVFKAGRFLERRQSGKERRSGTSVAGSARPAAGAVPARDFRGAGRRLAGRRGTGQTLGRR